jgi:hypothetical protein
MALGKYNLVQDNRSCTRGFDTPLLDDLPLTCEWLSAAGELSTACNACKPRLGVMVPMPWRSNLTSIAALFAAMPVAHAPHMTLTTGLPAVTGQHIQCTMSAYSLHKSDGIKTKGTCSFHVSGMIRSCVLFPLL